MGKKYLDINVYDAAVNRISLIFDEFEKIIVSFSGGKDSGVVLNLVIDEARRRGRRVAAMYIDLEAMYQNTVDFVERMFENNKDVLDTLWICLPMNSPNSLSYYEPVWKWWDPSKEDIWIREMPDYPYVINSENQKFDFYTPEITFEDFVTYIAEWYGKGEKVASLLGIRSDESLNRYRTIMSNKKEKYQGLSWSTLIRGRAYNFYPIYDWTVEDIWTYNGKFKKDYNHLYDLFYKAGVSVHKMRVDEPFGNEEKASLNMFRILEPSTWARVANRVSGANFGNIYSGNKIMTHRYQLPKGHTWKSFTEFLLSTLPKEIASNYRKRFKRFIDYWTMVGCPVNDGHVSILEEKYSNSIINTHTFSNRGNGDKEVVLFKEVLDEIPEIDSKTDVLSWRRMAMCIIKNDYVCKGLSFSITKNMTVRELQILKKYENI